MEAKDGAVDIRVQRPMTLLCVACEIDEIVGDFSRTIEQTFARIKRLGATAGFDPSSHRVVGFPRVSHGRLTGYQCCVEIPQGRGQPSYAADFRLGGGGRYAVLTLDKRSDTIGQTIARFLSVYVPNHHLQVDESRPPFEIYGDRWMEYWTPIRES